MEYRAHLKNVHMSPRKMRLVRSVIRGRAASEAIEQLTFMSGKASGIVLKVLRSAIANARHNFEAEEKDLVVSDLIVNEGIVMKRWRPVSKGMAHPILKRMSHVTVVLEERGVASDKRSAKKTEIADITPEEHIHQGHDHDHEEVTEVAEETQQPTAALEQPIPDKQQQAYSKQKMQQSGGDRAKSHRRKSLGGSK